MALFCEFLARLCAESVRRVVVLGDLFEYWVGPGHERLGEFGDVLGALRRLVEAGCEIAIVHGNRDFHLGEEFVRAVGAALLPEGGILAADGRRIAFAHGDLLIGRDTRYRAMRRLVRSRAFRRAFVALPLELRLGLARRLRKLSVREVARKDGSAFALAASAVERLFASGADAAVVGHVHRAQRIRLEVHGVPRVLFTLGSWEAGSVSYVEFARGRLTLRDGPRGERILTEEG